MMARKPAGDGAVQAGEAGALPSNSKVLVLGVRRPPNAGKGRVAGVPNKTTALIKEMIVGALDELGGQAYLVQQGRQSPTAFMALLSKVLPMQVTGADDGPLNIQTITRVIIDPKANG